MTPEVREEVARHDLTRDIVHSDYSAELCACSPGPSVASKPRPMTGLQDGGTCFACGGLTVRTGTCTTCTECFETGGCG